MNTNEIKKISNDDYENFFSVLTDWKKENPRDSRGSLSKIVDEKINKSIFLNNKNINEINWDFNADTNENELNDIFSNLSITKKEIKRTNLKLPNDVVNLIMEFLFIKNIFKCRLGKSINDIIDSSLAHYYNSGSYKNCKLLKELKINDFINNLIKLNNLNEKYKIKSVDLSNYSIISDENFRQLGAGCPEIKELKIPHISFDEQIGLGRLIRFDGKDFSNVLKNNFPKLKILHIKDCRFSTIFSSFLHLDSVYSPTTIVHIKNVRDILDNGEKQKKFLNLLYSKPYKDAHTKGFHVDDINTIPPFVSEATINLNNLLDIQLLQESKKTNFTKLNINDSLFKENLQPIFKKGFYTLGKKFTDINFGNIFNHINKKNLKQWCSLLKGWEITPSVVTFNVNSIKQDLDPEDFNTLFSLPIFSKVTKLSFNSDKTLIKHHKNNEIFKYAPFPNLESLSLSAYWYTDGNWIKKLGTDSSMYPNLQYLSIKAFYTLDTKLFLDLAKSRPHLQVHPVQIDPEKTIAFKPFSGKLSEIQEQLNKVKIKL